MQGLGGEDDTNVSVVAYHLRIFQDAGLIS
jgi:hypothetical protein